MRYGAAVLSAILLLGCGSARNTKNQIGFLNQSKHSDAELWAMWRQAQKSVANAIDLNPLQAVAGAVEMLPGDARALRVFPDQVSVAPEPDVAASVLAAVTGVRRSNPTGLIACPAPCSVGYAPAYSQYDPGRVRYAASWEVSESNFDYLLGYEFENQILFALGYDLRWR